ncbi:all-trans retinoic acid-induced differentiation factor isoform X1 [Protopterus annectens]|uniref:all-trans retinoic acid-induced differentiation factor isoform X1 n=1 Tax=Protopterus annectens TaxID=7888 RepID=UPI001CFBE2F4|nr:all-trans retinoic acid-induced differentiation factor isoform X1 [Protopterus annectens]
MAVRGGSVVYRYLLRLLVLHSFILIFSVLGSGIRVCSICPGEIRNGSAVAEFCYSNSSFVSERRCCLKKQNSQVVVVGLDFGNCSLSQIDTELQTASTAEVIDLTDNPLKNLPVSAFRGLVGLQYIVLPELVNCPGDDISWEEVNITANKRICKEQKNICGTTGQLVPLCPDSSMCEADGPGLFQCSCSDKFHGYRCLRKGAFPMMMFFGILGAVTIFCSIMLWYTQRRKAKLTF